MKIAINHIFFQPEGGYIKDVYRNLSNHIALCDHKRSYILCVLEGQQDYAKKMSP